MALIGLDEVTVLFDGIPAIKKASVKVEKGDYLVILGENGSGKSTLMRVMLGLVRPTRGAVTYGDGLAQDRIGYLPQQTAAQKDFPASVEEVVRSGCVNRLGARPWLGGAEKKRAEEKMRLLGLWGMRGRSYRTLSGGQQQRTLLARALCATDALLMLDEPVTGLDPDAADDMYSVIRRLHRENGTAIVMVSHDTQCALRDATHVLVMNNGVEFYGTVSEYKERRAL